MPVPRGGVWYKRAMNMLLRMRVWRAGLVAVGLAGAAAAGEKLVLVTGGDASGSGSLREPYAMAFDREGRLCIAGMAKDERIVRLAASRTLEPLAGTGEKGDAGDGGPATAARFNGIHNIVTGPAGELFVADTWNCRIRRIDPVSGTVHAFAGTGVKGFAGDGGPAAAALFGGIYSLAFAPGGRTLYAADLDNRRIRAVNLDTGVVATFAGDGIRGVPADGAEAARAPLTDPRAVAADARGNVYILERGGHALRVVGADGRIRTVVNRSGKKGATGDGGPAIEATMNGPKHLCVDRDGNVLIADAENHLVRKYLPADGRIVRVAGCGRQGVAGLGGPPQEAELNRPHGVAVDGDGAVYIADSYNGRVLKIVRDP